MPQKKNKKKEKGMWESFCEGLNLACEQYLAEQAEYEKEYKKEHARARARADVRANR